MRKVSSTVMVLVLLTTGLANAQDKKMDKAAMQKAAMEAMMRAAAVGDEHKKMDFMVGTWDAKVKYWPEAGAPAIESTGTSVNEWVLGGRWLQQKFEGSFMGAPFHGIGYSGYDNVRKMYVGTWMDNMSTQVMASSGNPGAGSTWSFTATGVDPMSGEAVSMEEKMRVIDKDHHVFEMWGPGMDGLNYKMMEISYSRRKK